MPKKALTKPNDMPIGLNYEVLRELLGDDAYKFAEEEWNRTKGKIIRRAVFINGRTFVPFIDSGSSEIHLVECESISLYEKGSRSSQSWQALDSQKRTAWFLAMRVKRSVSFLILMT